jgi:hypothetical protein
MLVLFKIDGQTGGSCMPSGRQIEVISLKLNTQITQGRIVGALCLPPIAHAQRTAGGEPNRSQLAGGQRVQPAEAEKQVVGPSGTFFLPIVNAGRLNHEHGALLLFWFLSIFLF